MLQIATIFFSLLCFFFVFISVDRLIYLFLSGDTITHFCETHIDKRGDMRAYEAWYKKQKIVYFLVFFVSITGLLLSLPMFIAQVF